MPLYNKSLLITLAYVFMVFPLYAQSTSKDSSYHHQMEQSLIQFKKGKTYLRSFRKTKETSYLNLAASFSKLAIQSYHRIQLSRLERDDFYYISLRKKLTVCSFLNQVIRAGEKENLEISSLDSFYCTH